MKDISKVTANLPARLAEQPVAKFMAPALVRRDPDTNLAAAISQLQKLGCSVCVKKQLVFPTNPKTGEMTGWREEVRGTDFDLSKDVNLGECAKVIGVLLSPAVADDIETWLTEVSAITARRSETVEEGALTLVAYSSRLGQYPADIVRETLKEWSGKWFPTWGELKEILDARAGPRRSIADGIARLMAPPPKPKKDVGQLKRELCLLQDGCVPFDLRFSSRDEQIEQMAARVLNLKVEIAQLEQGI